MSIKSRGGQYIGRHDYGPVEIFQPVEILDYYLYHSYVLTWFKNKWF